MSTVQIIVDSTCDLAPDMVAAHRIEIIPLYVILGEESFKDGLEIDPQKIYDYADRTKNTPKTAAASLQDFIDVFGPHAAAGEDIVFIGISSQMSSTCANAMVAAQEFPQVRIRVVDSRNLSTGIGLLVLEAARMAGEGAGADEIADALEEMTGRVRASFVVDTLTYLYRGGRCSMLQALGANALGIHPEIYVKDGRMLVGEKYRGRMHRAIPKYARSVLGNLDVIDGTRVFITHTQCEPEIIAAARDAVRATGHFNEVLETEAGCVITSHCGPGTLGILYTLK